MRNEITAVPFRRLGEDEVEVDLVLEPSESVLLVFQNRKRALPMRMTATSVPLHAPIEITRGETPPELIIPRASLADTVTVSPVTSDPFVGSCELPRELDLRQSCVYIELDKLTPEDAARVTINGQYAGGFIGKPYRLDVTRHLVSGRNNIIIEPFASEKIRLTVYPR
jgi:hypothetical protein